MISIEIVNLKLFAVNKSLATFKCDDSFSGVIHTTTAGNTTVILDGGYVLGKFISPHPAIDKLTDVHVWLKEAEKKNGTYSDYRKKLAGIVFH